MKKVLTILGARPQFIKAAALSRAIANNPGLGIAQDILHTGQHYDESLSQVFFDSLSIPKPRWQFILDSSDRPSRMEEMRSKISECVDESRPDAILVYGDTDSTLAGAQVAQEKGITLVHVEAGLRSFDLDMPEEVNRIETDKLSDILIAPTATAIKNLENEGIFGGFLTGDIMHDNAVHFSQSSESTDTVLLTMHRPSNVDDGSRVRRWLESIGNWAKSKGLRVVFPVHPRTKNTIEKEWGDDWKLSLSKLHIDAIAPVGYVELLGLINSSKLVVTDSGGVQKESYSCATPAVVIRHNTEWVELLEIGCTVLCPEPEDFSDLAEAQIFSKVDTSTQLYGDGKASESILEMLSERLNSSQNGQVVTLNHSNPSPRIEYAAKILFNVCLDVEYKWEEAVDKDKLICEYNGVVKEFSLHPICFSDEFEERLESLDPFSTVIYYAGMWSDVMEKGELDEHNRFVGNEVETPVVEITARQLAKDLGIEVDANTYKYEPTIDVDVAYAFKGRGVVHIGLALVRDFFTFNWAKFSERIGVLFGGRDPYDTYEYLDELHTRNGLPTRVFFLNAPFSKPYDVGLSFNVVEALRKRVEAWGWKTNWHPSYSAMTSIHSGKLDGFKKESGIFRGNVSDIRAHFLRSDARHWSSLVDCGIENDYSIGYASSIGFKSGMCRPFPAFDLKSNVELPLTIHPVIVMDSTLRSYLNYDEGEAIEIVRKLNTEVREVGGTMITLFHNTSVSDYAEWEGWRRVYEEIVEICA